MTPATARRRVGLPPPGHIFVAGPNGWRHLARVQLTEADVAAARRLGGHPETFALVRMRRHGLEPELLGPVDRYGEPVDLTPTPDDHVNAQRWGSRPETVAAVRVRNELQKAKRI